MSTTSNPAPASAVPQPTSGVIHDIGYRGYRGTRLGRSHIVRALYGESFRAAFGFGRSTKSKVMPLILLAVMCIPALLMVVVAIVSGSEELPLDYRKYVSGGLQPVVALFVASQAPVAVSRDLRFRVMPLYFSRPLRRADYVLAKFAAMATALFVMMAMPLTILYGGALLAKMSFGEQTRAFALGLVGVVLFAVVLSAIGLLIASITPKRGLGAAAIVVILLVLAGIQGLLQGLGAQNNNEALVDYAPLIDPFTLVHGVQMWALDAESLVPPDMASSAGATFAVATVGLVVICYAALLIRYRRVSAT